MAHLEFIVHGNPIPKQSFRFAKGGGYQPTRVTDWETEVAWAASFAMPPDKRHDEYPKDSGGFIVQLSFVRADRRRVDLDNLSKAVLDAMTGVVWTDDKLVYDLRLLKAYAPAPELACVEVIIDWVKEMTL